MIESSKNKLYDERLIGPNGWLDIEKLELYIEEEKANGNEIVARDFYNAMKTLIDWDDFYDWAERNESREGYEWIQKLLGFKSEEWLDQDWIKDDGMLDWDQVAADMDNNSSEPDPEEVYDFLEEYSSVIDWKEFTRWSHKVRGYPEY